MALAAYRSLLRATRIAFKGEPRILFSSSKLVTQRPYRLTALHRLQMITDY